MRFKSAGVMPKGELIRLGKEIDKIEAPNYKFGAIFSYVRLLNLTHAYDLIETEGIYPFVSYMHSLMKKEKVSKAVESLVKESAIAHSVQLAEARLAAGEEHPKVDALINELNSRHGCKAIIFAQYRSTVRMLASKLQLAGFSAKEFVGKRDGVTQQQQKRILDEFRSGEFSILVASSIGEEGLDIPAVDVVVFYEPIPSEIRNIQRRGRTGRFAPGEVILLIATGTKDEIYFMVSRKREAQMTSLIGKIKMDLDSKLNAANEIGQQRL
jgi:Fanconi anemia group M protein